MSVQIYVEVVRYVNLSRWSKFPWPKLLSDSLFAPTQLYVDILLYIKKFYRHLGIYFNLVPALIVLGRKIQMGIPFGDPPLILLVPRNYFCWYSCWNFPAGTLELIPFGARSDGFFIRNPRRFLLGIPPCFPPLGFTLIVLFARNSVFPVGGLLFFSFLGGLH